MKNLTKSLILGFILAPMYLPPLHAQADGSTSGDTRPSTAKPTPTGQAPDDVMKKLSDLVHAGKYAEAQQLTAGLLLAYPEDQRLIKAKVMLDKLFVPASAAQTTPNNNPPASSGSSAQLAMNTNAKQFTGMEKVDYDALIELARQAQQSTDLGQQKTLLKQFMDQSSLFVHEHPNELLLWQLRAAAAISLNDPVAGYEAGRRLLLTGVADGTDPNLRRLLAQLRNKGWLDQQVVEAAKKEAKYAWVSGTWSVSWSYSWAERTFAKGGGHPGRSLADNGVGANEEFSKSGSVIEGHRINGGAKSAEADIRGTVLDSGEISWERYLPASCDETYPVRYDGGAFSLRQPTCYPSGWQPVLSFELVNDKRITMVVPSQHWSQTKNTETEKYAVTLLFTRIESTP